MVDSVPLKSLVELFAALFILGNVLTIPLFKFDYHKFFSSKLFIKIAFWIPIFIIFIGVLYASNYLRILVLLSLIVASLVELLRIKIKNGISKGVAIYFLFFVIGISHFYLIGRTYQSSFVNLMISLCFVTVLSDVAAFFFGNYLGKHKLPKSLNDRKSWEGVFGQMIGAFVGVILVNSFVDPVVSIWIFLPLGLGCALGDLANSWAKRQAGVKDWSNAIPGHGGFTDRFSSMAGSAAMLFWFLKLTGIS